MTEVTDVLINKFELKHADVADPVAAKVSWNPARRGGASFRTHKLKISRTTVEVQRSVGLVLFGSLFMAAGAIPVGLGLSPTIEDGLARGIALVFGGIFMAVGYAVLRGNDLLTFDKTRGIYFRGRRYAPDPRANRDRQGRLSDVHALQLISETVSGSKGGSYTSHELNLVFSDGERVNVMDHGDRQAIENSAKQLAGFLGVPIWQAVY